MLVSRVLRGDGWIRHTGMHEVFYTYMRCACSLFAMEREKTREAFFLPAGVRDVHTVCGGARVHGWRIGVLLQSLRLTRPLC